MQESGIAHLLEELHTSKETLEEECNAQLREAYRQLRLYGGKAKLTITIDIKREEKYENFFHVSADTKLVAPKPPKKGAPMFGNQEHGFSVNDQQQTNIFDHLTPTTLTAPQLQPAASNVATLNRKEQ